MAGMGIISQPHYWITERSDSQTDAWAEKNNVLVIRYQASSPEHLELVDTLNNLASYVQPDDEPSPPVSLELDFSAARLESPKELVTKDPEHIRSTLNSHASMLLKAGDENSFKDYEKFSLEYDRAIHSAWYTSVFPGQNTFLGYQLQEEVARGAFGVVFRAIDQDGNSVAVKLLHAEIRKNADLLSAFRRGVRSMKILEENGISGMVRYIGASEIPATLIMEWVNGPDLNVAVQSHFIADWNQILDISNQLATSFLTRMRYPKEFCIVTFAHQILCFLGIGPERT